MMGGHGRAELEKLFDPFTPNAQTRVVGGAHIVCNLVTGILNGTNCASSELGKWAALSSALSRTTRLSGVFRFSRSKPQSGKRSH